jgi:outer membrane protein assembly factor BamD (BamD/ComL family)
MVRTPTSAAVLLALASLAAGVAQTETYTLTPGAESGPRQWDAAPESQPVDEAIADARRAIAEKDYARAQRLMDEFIEHHQREDNAYLPEAYLLRADSYLGRGFEYKALFDLERILREFPESEHFITANERELDIALAYASGLKRRVVGFRLFDATDYAVEILIRVQERLPGSALAEEAAIALADFYYERREMKLARDAYDLYILNFPTGPNRLKADRRLVFADIARFKGPRYDSSGLLDARVRIRNFERRYPGEAERIGLNDGMVARIDESLAAQLLESARWYLTQNDDPAARITLTRLLADHPRTFAATEALALAERKGWDIAPTTPATTVDPDAPAFEGPGASNVQPVEPPAPAADPDAPPPPPTP